MAERHEPYARVTTNRPQTDHTFVRCTVDEFTKGTLTVTSIDTEAVVREYARDKWRHGAAFDRQGYAVASFSNVPPTVIVRAVKTGLYLQDGPSAHWVERERATHYPDDVSAIVAADKAGHGVHGLKLEDVNDA